MKLLDTITTSDGLIYLFLSSQWIAVYVFVKQSFPLINRNFICEFLIISNANKEFAANLQPIQPV